MPRGEAIEFYCNPALTLKIEAPLRRRVSRFSQYGYGRDQAKRVWKDSPNSVQRIRNCAAAIDSSNFRDSKTFPPEWNTEKHSQDKWCLEQKNLGNLSMSWILGIHTEIFYEMKNKSTGFACNILFLLFT